MIKPHDSNTHNKNHKNSGIFEGYRCKNMIWVNVNPYIRISRQIWTERYINICNFASFKPRMIQCSDIVNTHDPNKHHKNHKDSIIIGGYRSQNRSILPRNSIPPLFYSFCIAKMILLKMHCMEEFNSWGHNFFFIHCHNWGSNRHSN